jgi:hypothetical protein
VKGIVEIKPFEKKKKRYKINKQLNYLKQKDINKQRREEGRTLLHRWMDGWLEERKLVQGRIKEDRRTEIENPLVQQHFASRCINIGHASTDTANYT